MIEPCLSDVFLWPNGDWCYRADKSIQAIRSDDFRVIGFATRAFYALFEEFDGDGAAYLVFEEFDGDGAAYLASQREGA